MVNGKKIEKAIGAIAQEIHRSLLQELAKEVPAKVVSKLRHSTTLGKKLDMRCRVPRCKQRSSGPRFLYMCENHQKLPKRTQLNYIAKYNNAAA